MSTLTRLALAGACIGALAIGLARSDISLFASAGDGDPPHRGGRSPSTASGDAPSALHPGLVTAFRRARSEAADDGHRLVINSGYRTPAHQRRLLNAEIAARGSLAAASRWVFPPDRSMHVQGLAIDVGDGPAADWLDAHGRHVGLCRTLAWEWWHFEWRQRWEDDGACPTPADDPADAPGP